MSRSTLDRLGPPLSVKLAGGAQGVITGFASTFGDPPDSYGDTVAPGAFAGSLADHRAAGTSPAMLWSHNPSEPIGRWIDTREDAAGLRVEGRLTMDLQRAKDAFALARDGALGLSIGYRVLKSDRNGTGGRLLKQLQLAEVSLVAMPANTAARIIGVKSVAPPDIDDPRAFETFLREAGFSRSFARACTAAGFKAAAGQRDADGADRELAREIRAAASMFRKITKG